jgi:hypothetical protein
MCRCRLSQLVISDDEQGQPRSRSPVTRYSHRIRLANSVVTCDVALVVVKMLDWDVRNLQHVKTAAGKIISS